MLKKKIRVFRMKWHYWLDGHEFEKALGVGDGQGSLACCSPRGHKELDMTEQLNWIDCVNANQYKWNREGLVNS